MKKILALVLALTLALAFAACGVMDEPAPEPEENQEATVEEQSEEPGDEEVIDSEDEAEGNTDEEEPAEEEQVKENLVDPSEITPRGDEPPAGDDKSIKGIPDLIDVLTYDDGDLLVLVNKYHGVVSDYEPEDMITMDNSLTTWENIKLKKEAYDAYMEMYEDAKKEGYDLKVCSGYRSYDGQQQLFTNAINSYSPEFAHMYSAYPGRSEHHTGLAIDITSASMGWGLKQDFADYPDGQWLDEHCQDYGFILRYTKDGEEITGYMYEPWHFRYVGKEVAEEIMEKGITLEEYLGKE